MQNFQVYLLAAGLGRRSGGPKAWRTYGGKTLLEKQIEFLLKHFPAEQVTVSIQEPWRRRCEKIEPKVHWIAEDPQTTPLSALQALLKDIPMTRWAFIYHVDMPVWEPELFEMLARAITGAEGSAAEAIAPVYQHSKGHPMLLSPKLAALLQNLDPTKDRLDFWLRTRKEASVEVPFSCIHENWNQGGSPVGGNARELLRP